MCLRTIDAAAVVARALRAMGRKIVVGYRPDEHGEDAIALARELASSRLAGRVVVVQVLDGEDAEQAERRLDPLTQGWPEHVSVSARAVAGDSVTKALRSLAEEERADVLVLGSTHRGRTGRVLRGTTADHVAPDASWPIVVAPEGFRDSPRPLRRIGVAFDGSDESRFALDWAVGVASEVSAGLRLIAVGDAPPPPVETWGPGVPPEAWDYGLAVPMTEEVLGEVRARMERNLASARSSIGQPDVETATILGDTVTELRDAAVDLGLLVVGSHSRGRLQSVLMGSVSRGLIHSCPAPLAVIPFFRSAE